MNRVYRLMRDEGLKAQVGYRKPRHRSGESHIVVPNRLQRQFNPESPDESWVTDITHIRTHEAGFTWLWLSICSHAKLSVGRCNHVLQEEEIDR